MVSQSTRGFAVLIALLGWAQTELVEAQTVEGLPPAPTVPVVAVPGITMPAGLQRNSPLTVDPQHLALPTSAAAANVSSGVMTPSGLSTIAGRTAGNYAVSAIGTATYSIPIWSVPGARGVEPHLALVYSSSTPDGFFGSGWTLAGLSAISRCTLTYAQDGAGGAVTLTSSDRYCLDGNRMRLTSASGTYGQTNSTYQTEIANFSNLVASSTSAGNGPAYFTVHGKDGLIYEYGNAVGGTNTAQVFASGTTTPYLWLLDKVSDRLGNNMIIQYQLGNGGYLPSLIQYTQTPATSTTYHNRISFSYATRPSKQGYVAGGTVQQTSVISTITASSDNVPGSIGTMKTVRTMNLGYTNGVATGRPHLTSVQECSLNYCFPATSVGYQDGTAGIGSPTTTAVASGASNVDSADFDGDGHADLVYAVVSGSTRHWYVRFSTSSGYGAAQDTGAVTASTDPVLFDDFLGEGRAGILAPSSGTWTLYRWNAATQTFTSTSLGLTLDANRVSPVLGSPYASADINGDGLPDLLWPSSDGYIHARMNQSNGVTPQFGGDGNTGVSFASLGGTLWQFAGNNSFPNSSVRHMDFDGDGRQDLMIEMVNLLPASDKVYELLGRGSTLTFGTTFLSVSLHSMWPLNWNDDACTDLAIVQTYPSVYLSGCNGSLPGNISLGTVTPTDGLAADWNGDGRTDFLVNVSGTWQVYVSQSTTAAPIASTGIAAGTGSWLALDQNGDGLDDLAFVNSSTGAVIFGVHNGVGVQPDLATSFTDGYGMNSSPTYVSLARDSTYTKYTDGSYPNVDWQGPMYVVTSTTASDGAGGTYSQSFNYYGAHMNLQGRGFDGFYAQQTADNRAGTLLDTRYFARSFPYVGMLIEHDRSQPSPSFKVASQTLYTLTATTLDSTSNNQRYFPYTKTITEADHEVGGTDDGNLVKQVVATYTYDTYGNATGLSIGTTDKDSASPWTGQTWTTTTTNTITNDTTNWCLGHPTQTTVQNTLPNTTSVTRTTSATVDYVNCRETNIIDEPSNPALKVTRNLSFNPAACGNVSEIDVIGSGPDGSVLPARTTTVNYGSMCESPEKVTNPLGELTTLAYNYALGMRSSSKDANSLVTSFAYDDFGQLQKTTRPDGTYTTYSITACNATNSYCGVADLRSNTTRVDASTTGSAIHTAYLYEDGFGRPRYREEQNLASGVDYHVTHYDPVGRTDLRYMPFSTGSQDYHQYTYDLLGRVLLDKLYRETSGFDRQTQYAYAGAQFLTTDPKLNSTTRYLNVLGQVGTVLDPSPGGTSQLTYEPFGQLSSASDTVNVSTWTYDARGHLIGNSDPDRGVWTYESDSLGELVHIRDANTTAPGWTQQLSYDLLGRLIYRADGAAISRWVWGASAGMYDKLNCENGSSDTICTGTPSGYREVYGYDSVGRLTSTTYSADTTYAVSYAYNATTGLLDNLTYPTTLGSSPLRVQYSYTNGFLSKVSDYNTPSTVYWQLNTQDAWDQPTNEQFQNGVHVLSSTDDLTGHLNSRSSGTNSGVYTNQQNVSYEWDPNENLTDRIDVNQGNLDEHFTYDALNRVTGSTLAGSPNLNVSFDAIGNITQMDSVGTYDYITQQSGCNYTGLTAQPHAVRKAGSYVFCYDKNGNMLTGRGATFSWTPYNVPASVTNGSVQSSFLYTPDRRLWKQAAQYSGGPETTIYIGGVLEKVSGATTTDYVHLIRAGSMVALVIRSTGTNNQTYYLTQDHLGSSTAITDSSGALVVDESYAAYGTRRGTNWTGTPSSGDWTNIAKTTRHGFTGQVMLDNLNLVHMNGRVYDNVIGRFTSADPFTVSADYSQGYNRYSYVNNYSLTFVDPSGFCSSPRGVGTLEVCPDDPSPPPDPSPPTEPYDGCVVGAPMCEVDIYGRRGGPAPTTYQSPTSSPSHGGGRGGPQRDPMPNQNPQNCPASGTLARIGTALSNWGSQTASLGGKFAGYGADLALGSAAVGLIAPVTAPVTGPLTAAGLAASAVGGGVTIVGGVLQWVGAVLSQNPSAAANGYFTATVNAALTAIDAPPLPSLAPDPAEMIAQAAGISSESGVATCP